jgi:hypothetical protein
MTRRSASQPTVEQLDNPTADTHATEGDPDGESR